MSRPEAPTDGLARARALAGQGQVKDALKLAESERERAFAAEDVDVLRRVRELAGAIYSSSQDKDRERAGRLSFIAQQNIRFLSRKQAVATGEAWVDPFPAQPVQQPAPTGPTHAEPDEGPPPLRKLAAYLVVSLLTCAFLALAGAGEGASSDTEAFWILGVFGVYWLVSAVLMTWWWGRGYDHFARPMVSWGLSLLVVASLLGLPLLLLLLPRFRRWLFAQLKPYDTRPADRDASERSRARAMWSVLAAVGAIALLACAGVVAAVVASGSGSGNRARNAASRSAPSPWSKPVMDAFRRAGITLSLDAGYSSWDTMEPPSSSFLIYVVKDDFALSRSSLLATANGGVIRPDANGIYWEGDGTATKRYGPNVFVVLPEYGRNRRFPKRLDAILSGLELAWPYPPGTTRVTQPTEPAATLLDQALLKTDYNDSELPKGFVGATTSDVNPNDVTSAGHRAAAVVAVDVVGPDDADVVLYNIFPKAADAQVALDTARANGRAGPVDGYPKNRSAYYTGKLGAGVLVADGGTLVVVITTDKHKPRGNLPAALALLKSAVKHLEGVKRTLSNAPAVAAAIVSSPMGAEPTGLYRRLLTRTFARSQLPAGFVAARIVPFPSQPDTVEIDFKGPDMDDSILYSVFRSAAAAGAYLQQTRADLEAGGMRPIGNVPGFPRRASAYLTGNADNRPHADRLTALLALQGRVVVGVYTTRPHGARPRSPGALALMRSALEHLRRSAP